MTRLPSYTAFRFILLVLLIALLASPMAARAAQIAAIASAHPLATRAGEEVLAAGGNAFDAAVAVSAALGVVEPFGSGLGGGGFWLLHRARDGLEVMVDGREVAPLRAKADMYLGPDGTPSSEASLVGARAAAIPGTPAALSWIAVRYGRLTLRRNLAPAVRYAREGFHVDRRYLEIARSRSALLEREPEAAGIFLADGAVPGEGFRLRQPALACTLAAIADRGRAGFYDGPVAAELVRSVQAGGGIWTLEDLRHYRVEERVPQKITYFDATLTTAPLPSAGGLTLAQALNILRRFPLAAVDEGERAHLIAEALRRGYQDRVRYLGDPAFVQVPADRLASDAYGAERAASIRSDRATPSSELESDGSTTQGGASTSHFSIVDAEGNRVAATLSLNTQFGSGYVAGATGVLLNNEMDDFAIAPGVGNAYGLVGGVANAIEPGKRPISSMTPTFVEDERGVLVLGTPGGSRIISMVLLAALDYLHDPHWTAEKMMAAPRFHQQFLPDRVEIEPEGFSPAWREALERRGHFVEVAQRRWGNMQAVYRDRKTGRTRAVSDPRGFVGEWAWF